MVRVQVGHLSEEERLKVLSVIQRDFELRQQEQSRLSKLNEVVTTEASRTEALCKQTEFNKTHCIHCYRSFFILINPKEQCERCKLYVCRRCSQFDSQQKIYTCKLCSDAVAVKEKSCDWFYESVTKRFKHFGSAKVVRSLIKKKSTAKSDTEDGSELFTPSARSASRPTRPTLQAVFGNVNDSKLNSDGSLKTLLERLSPEQVDEFRLQLTSAVTEMRRDIDASLPAVTSSTDEDAQNNNERNQLQTAHRLKLQTLLAHIQHTVSHSAKVDIMSESEASNTARAEIKHSILREVERLLGSPVDMPWEEVTSDFFSEDELCSDPLQRAFEEQLAEAIVNKVWHTARSEREELKRRLGPELSRSGSSDADEPMSLAGSSRTGSLTRIPEEDVSGHEVALRSQEIEEVVEEIPDDAEILNNLDFFKQHQQDKSLPGLEAPTDLRDDPDAIALGSKAQQVQELAVSRLELSNHVTDESDLDAELEEREKERTRARKNWFMQTQQVSPYDNCGTRLVGKDLGEPVTMHIPRGLPCSPRVGHQLAETLSDMSENETDSEHSSDGESGVSDEDSPRLLRELRHRGPRARTSQLVASGMFRLRGEQPQIRLEDMIRNVARQRTITQCFVDNSDALRFTSSPGPLTVTEGDTAVMSCQLSGDGIKDVFWFREGDDDEELVLLEEDERTEITSSNDSHVLNIYSCSEADTGRYMCLALSETGQCSCSLPLSVQGVSDRTSWSAPVFSLLPTDVRLEEGGSARFTCRVSGSPEPRLLWYRSADRIGPGDRARVERVRRGAETLHIDYALLADSALYKVTASSAAGRASHEFKVTVVKRQASAADDDFSTVSRRLAQSNTQVVARPSDDLYQNDELNKSCITNVPDACLVDTLTQLNRLPGHVPSLRHARFVLPDIPEPKPVSDHDASRVYENLGKGTSHFDQAFVKILKGSTSRLAGQLTFSEFEREYCATQLSRDRQRLELEARQREKSAEEYILGARGKSEQNERKQLEEGFVQLQDIGSVSGEKFSRRVSLDVVKPIDKSRYVRDFEVPEHSCSQHKHWEVNVPYRAGSVSSPGHSPLSPVMTSRPEMTSSRQSVSSPSELEHKLMSGDESAAGSSHLCHGYIAAADRRLDTSHDSGLGEPPSSDLFSAAQRLDAATHTPPSSLSAPGWNRFGAAGDKF